MLPMMRPALALIVLLVTAACGERNNPFGSGTTSSDRTAPAVVSTVPSAFGTQVGLSAPVTVTFSEPMSVSSITAAAFALAPTVAGSSAITGTVSYTGNTATFTPTSGFQANTEYRATVTTGVRDVAGNALAAPYTWTFTTGPT